MLENETVNLVFKLLFGGLFLLLGFFYLFGVLILLKYGRSKVVVFLASGFAGLLLLIAIGRGLSVIFSV